MKLTYASITLACAAAQVNANALGGSTIIGNLRRQLSAANFDDPSTTNLLKFYADNFLWSITELYKGFKGIYYDVAKLREEMEDNEDLIKDLEDEIEDYDDRIDDLEDLIKDLEDKIEAAQETLDAIKDQNQDALDDAFFEDTFGSGAGPWVAADVVDAMKEHMDFDDMSGIDQMMAGMHLDQVENLIDNYDPSSQSFDDFKDSVKDHFDAAAEMPDLRDEEQELAQNGGN